MPISNTGTGSVGGGGTGGGTVDLPEGSVLPSRYQFLLDSEGGLILKDEVEDRVALSVNRQGLSVEGAVKSKVNTILLEDAHSLTSLGEQVGFKNLETNTVYSPPWHGIKEDVQDVIPLSAPVFGPVMYGHHPLVPTSNVPVDPQGKVLGQFSLNPSYNFVMRGFTVYIADHTGPSVLEVVNSKDAVIYRIETSETSSVTDFLGTLYMRSSDTWTFRVVDDKGNLLSVRPCATEGYEDVPWVSTTIRTFEDHLIPLLDAEGKLDKNLLPNFNATQTITVSNKQERLALPVSSNFRIVIEVDTHHTYYLEANKLASDEANWVYGGSTEPPASNHSHGDVKTSYRVGDHDGWYKLDGREVRLLPAPASAAALLLGFDTHLPDSTGKGVVGAGVADVGSVDGSSIISRDMLPNRGLGFNGTTTSNNRTHTHAINPPATSTRTAAATEGLGTDYRAVAVRDGTAHGSFNPVLDSSGASRGLDVRDIAGISLAILNHDHVVDIPSFTSGSESQNHTHDYEGTTESLNGGVTQKNFVPPHIKLNMFVYLGE